MVKRNIYIFASDYSLIRMTEKQEKILQSALELFAKEGYRSTSTSKVAKHAGVSEGLIFRHFGNKEGLLDAITKEGEERVKVIFADIVLETNPRSVILKTIDSFTPGKIDPEELEFWKLQYKIKWELEQYNEQKMEPLHMALSNAFRKLGYAKPEIEAQILLVIMDGLATRYFLQKGFDWQPVVNSIKEKYMM